MNEISDIIRDFAMKFMHNGPYAEFVNGCSLQTISFMTEQIGCRIPGNPNDPCIYVFLEKPLLYGAELPKNYNGIHVISKVMGPIDDEY